MSSVSFVWLEITGKCQLACTHCYADSGPGGSHGAMTTESWRRVIDEAAGMGVRMVQFIGGEPTLYPELPSLIDHALHVGVEVEVFSNLVHVTPAMWKTFDQPGLRLACSYYSDDAGQHAQVTGRAGSHRRTRANIVEALRRSIPLRVGVINLDDDQRTEQAMTELSSLGVTDVGLDRLRQVGRGERSVSASMDQLCGNCADSVVAVSPDGAVWPCVFTRWLPVGNVLESSLPAVTAGRRLAEVRQDLTEHFTSTGAGSACRPSCHPDCSPACQPTCPPNCSPSCHPTNCGPNSCWPGYR